MAPTGNEAHPLRVVDRPEFEVGEPAVTLVDLFSGCGGLTLGVAQAANGLGHALDVRLAVDNAEEALDVYRLNFPKATTMLSSIETVLKGAPGSKATAVERKLQQEVGSVDVLVGGPPCQGHSDLNNHTRRTDPKNELYLHMLRAAELFSPKVVLIENVPGVRHADGNVVGRVRSGLIDLGYEVADQVVAMVDLGIPQTRRRHVLLAIDGEQDVTPSDVFEGLTPTQRRDLRWAIGDLLAADPQGLDRPPHMSGDNLRRMMWMLQNGKYDLPNELRPPCHQDGEHSYKSMYGRLRWNEPAQTVTSGFGSIGQGRYMHPEKPRALTPHEAARIQGFPDYFDFSTVSKRAPLADIIGNAVPPGLASALLTPILAKVMSPQEL